MPNLDKAKVAIGLQSGKSKFDLSCDHITSSNFMQLQPVYYRHMIPGERISVNANAFTRLMPMAVPTFGRMRLNMRAFFVPFRTVFPNFTDMITDVISNYYGGSGIVNSTPIITNQNLVSFFVTYGTDSVTQSDVWDIKITSSSTPQYKVFNQLGRRAYKILRSLGYCVNWDSRDNTEYSALALLSFVKVYFDWYTVSQYQDSNMYNEVEKLFKYNATNTPLSLTPLHLKKFMDFTSMVNFEGDYFTAAWDSPVAPSPNMTSNDYVINDITMDASTQAPVQQNTSLGPNQQALNTPYIAVSDKIKGISQFNIDSLKALTDYLKRHQLSGARAIDRYLADFGLNLAADKLQRSIYLGNNSIDINISDVMSTANTAPEGSPSTLGDFGGQGVGNGSKTFEYECAEFGLFVICASFLPSGGYVQGYDRNNLHIKRTDFFVPDYDGLGCQAIARGELFIPNDGSFYGAGFSHGGVFGYTPRYAEYKVGRDFFTSDLSYPSMNNNGGGNSWHLFRIFDAAYFNNNPASVVHTLGFCRGHESDVEDFDRIFVDAQNDSDKFMVIYHFNVASYAPCKSLFDTYDFANKMKQVTMDANGVKLN